MLADGKSNKCLVEKKSLLLRLRHTPFTSVHPYHACLPRASIDSWLCEIKIDMLPQTIYLSNVECVIRVSVSLSVACRFFAIIALLNRLTSVVDCVCVLGRSRGRTFNYIGRVYGLAPGANWLWHRDCVLIMRSEQKIVV